MEQMFHDSMGFTLGIVSIAWGIFFLYWCHEFYKGAQIYKAIPHIRGREEEEEKEMARKVLEALEEE